MRRRRENLTIGIMRCGFTEAGHYGVLLLEVMPF